MIIINNASYSNVSVTYTANGSQTVFSFPFDYLRKAFVYVEVNANNVETVLEQGTDYSVVNKTVVFNTAPSSGAILRIYRNTDTIPLVSWADASVLRAKDMTIQQAQVLHILEEYKGQYDSDLANMLIIAGVVTDSGELQHIVNQLNAITNNTNIASNAATTATNKANEASSSAASASNAATTATNKANEASSSAASASTSATNASNSASSAQTTATQLMDYLETKETLTAPAVDPTLTISGAAADAKITGDAIKSTKAEMSLFGIDDLLWDNTNPTTKTQSGVTYTVDNVNKSVTVSSGGNPSTSASVLNFYFDLSNIPSWLQKGKKYYAYLNTDTDIFIHVMTDATTFIASAHNYVAFVIPNDATGLIIRLYLDGGKTVNTVVRPMISETLPINVGLSALADTISRKGFLPDNTDINDVVDTGFYNFMYGSTYTNLPDGITYISAVLTVYKANEIVTYQTLFCQYPFGKQFIRQNTNGTWSAWYETGKGENAVSKKYVAFGDSLTWGAVWPATQGETLFQANIKYRIPTRIALATGLIDNFANEGVGGTGYVHAYAGQTITSKILNYDFTGVQLVTVMGGANDVDGVVELGTSASTAGDGTICGAIKLIIDYIKTNYPKTQVVFIQMTPVSSSADSWGTEYYGKWSLNTYDAEVSQLCHNNHVGYVNWWESLYVDTWIQHSGGYNGDIGPNYSHPKVEEDYVLLGDFIGGKISALCKGLN